MRMLMESGLAGRESDADLKTAAGKIASGDVSTQAIDNALCNCQTQSVAIAPVLATTEGGKDVRERFRHHAWTLVRNADRCLRGAVWRDLDADPGVFRGMAQGIPYDVFQRSVQEVRVSTHDQRVRLFDDDFDISGARFKTCILDQIVKQFVKQEAFLLSGFSCIEAGKGEQFPDQTIHPLALAFNAGHCFLETSRLLAGQPDGCLQAGEGGA